MVLIKRASALFIFVSPKENNKTKPNTKQKGVR